MKNSINADLKNVFAHLYDIFFFLILHKFYYIFGQTFRYNKVNVIVIYCYWPFSLMTFQLHGAGFLTEKVHTLRINWVYIYKYIYILNI